MAGKGAGNERITPSESEGLPTFSQLSSEAKLVEREALPTVRRQLDYSGASYDGAFGEEEFEQISFFEASVQARHVEGATGASGARMSVQLPRIDMKPQQPQETPEEKVLHEFSSAQEKSAGLPKAPAPRAGFGGFKFPTNIPGLPQFGKKPAATGGATAAQPQPPASSTVLSGQPPPKPQYGAPGQLGAQPSQSPIPPYSAPTQHPGYPTMGTDSQYAQKSPSSMAPPRIPPPSSSLASQRPQGENAAPMENAAPSSQSAYSFRQTYGAPSQSPPSPAPPSDMRQSQEMGQEMQMPPPLPKQSAPLITPLSAKGPGQGAFAKEEGQHGPAGEITSAGEPSLSSAEQESAAQRLIRKFRAMPSLKAESVEGGESITDIEAARQGTGEEKGRLSSDEAGRGFENEEGPSKEEGLSGDENLGPSDEIAEKPSGKTKAKMFGEDFGGIRIKQMDAFEGKGEEDGDGAAEEEKPMRKKAIAEGKEEGGSEAEEDRADEGKPMGKKAIAEGKEEGESEAEEDNADDEKPMGKKKAADDEESEGAAGEENADDEKAMRKKAIAEGKEEGESEAEEDNADEGKPMRKKAIAEGKEEGESEAEEDNADEGKPMRKKSKAAPASKGPAKAAKGKAAKSSAKQGAKIKAIPKSTPKKQKKNADAIPAPTIAPSGDGDDDGDGGVPPAPPSKPKGKKDAVIQPLANARNEMPAPRASSMPAANKMPAPRASSMPAANKMPAPRASSMPAANKMPAPRASSMPAAKGPASAPTKQFDALKMPPPKAARPSVGSPPSKMRAAPDVPAEPEELPEKVSTRPSYPLPPGDKRVFPTRQSVDALRARLGREPQEEIETETYSHVSLQPIKKDGRVFPGRQRTGETALESEGGQASSATQRKSIFPTEMVSVAKTRPPSTSTSPHDAPQDGDDDNKTSAPVSLLSAPASVMAQIKGAMQKSPSSSATALAPPRPPPAMPSSRQGEKSEYAAAGPTPSISRAMPTLNEIKGVEGADKGGGIPSPNDKPEPPSQSRVSAPTVSSSISAANAPVLGAKPSSQEKAEGAAVIADEIYFAYARERARWIYDIYKMGGMSIDEFRSQVKAKMSGVDEDGPQKPPPQNDAFQKLNKELEKKFRK